MFYLVKVIIMKKTHQPLTVMEGELRMLRIVKGLVAASNELKLFGKIACDFLSCDKHLLSGVTIRLSLRRSPKDLVVISEDAAKHYKVQIVEANLYVRKMTVTDYFSHQQKENFVEEPGNLQLHRKSTKNFSRNCRSTKRATRGCFRKRTCSKNDSSNEHKRSILCTNRTNPFHYPKFGLTEILVYRNGLPIAGTLISTSDNKRIYYNTL